MQNATENTKDKSHADSGKTNGHIKNSKHESNGHADADNDDETTKTNQFIKIEENAKSRHGPTNDKTMKVNKSHTVPLLFFSVFNKNQTTLTRKLHSFQRKQKK